MAIEPNFSQIHVLSFGGRFSIHLSLSAIPRSVNRSTHSRFSNGDNVLFSDKNHPRRDAAKNAQAAAKELMPADGRGGSITGFELDVRDVVAVGSIVDATVERRGRLDFMFNNAGISMGGETHHLAREECGMRLA